MKPGSTHERVLVVGDPHLKVSRLEDAREFLDKLVKEAIDGAYTKVVVLGDLFDSFAVIRSEVLSLWVDAVRRLENEVGADSLVLMVGNHDYAGLRGGSHALEAFKGLAVVVDEVSTVEVGGAAIWFMPFHRDNAVFEALCREIPAKSVLFCHQSFNGARFENGFYDPHGADPACVAHLARVVSGHVHSSQSVGENVWYPGTPFQHSFAEAGQRKAVFHMSVGLDPDGNSFAEMHRAIDLDMPRFEVLEFPSVPEIALPDPDPRVSYKVVAPGTPQEIAEFWRDERSQAFRKGARRVVDALVTRRDAEPAPGQENGEAEDKLAAFIMSRNWRTPREELLGRARKALAD